MPTTPQTPTAQQLQTLTQSVQNSSAFSPSQRASALGAIQNAYGSGQSSPPVGSSWNTGTNSWNAPPVTVNVNARELGTGTQSMVSGAAPSTAFSQSNITAGNIAGGADNATGIYNTQVNSTTGEQASPATAQEAFNQYVSQLEKPADLASEYNRAQREAGLIQAQQNRQNIQNQLNAETTRMNLDLQGLRGIGAKEGVTEAVYGQQSAQVTREASARILPLQAQLAMAQDNLEVAQERTDTLFNMYSKDAQNKVDHWNNLVKANYDFFTTEEKKKLDAQSKAETYNMGIYKDQITSINDAAQQALKDGNTALYRSLTKTPPPLYTNSADYAQKMNEWSNTMNANVVKYGGETDNTVTMNNAINAYAQNYSDSGTLPSPSELKQSGLNIGQITQQAKQLPKAEGTLVSRTTGVKQKGLSSAQEDGISSLFDLTKKLNTAEQEFSELNTGLVSGVAKTIFYTKAQQKYDNLKSEIVDLLARARSGAALTQDEVKNYESRLPGRFNKSFFLGGSGVESIKNLKSSIENKLNTNLNTNNLALYGYSNVDVNGTKRTVGELLNIGGINYKVLPDGTLTDQL